MIDRGSEVSVKRQAELLDVPRASVYYRPRPASAATWNSGAMEAQIKPCATVRQRNYPAGGAR